MERALNGTKMGNSMLTVNVARFAAENSSLVKNLKMATGSRQEKVTGGNINHIQINNQAYIHNGGGKLFSDLFSKGAGSKACAPSMESREGKVVEAPEDTLTF
ncbi:hypothetical protein HanIR_Chr11g0555421 [Helianthus annuus]|nr:hypothetical protein HanIR_Chr11g0555421 [Helianthus annuus]